MFWEWDMKFKVLFLLFGTFYISKNWFFEKKWNIWKTRSSKEKEKYKTEKDLNNEVWSNKIWSFEILNCENGNRSKIDLNKIWGSQYTNN